MTRKQLQALISAGIFSTALLTGVAYADDSTPNTSGTTGNTAATATTNTAPMPVPTATNVAPMTAAGTAATQPAKQTTSAKMPMGSGCAGPNGCGGVAPQTPPSSK